MIGRVLCECRETSRVLILAAELSKQEWQETMSLRIRSWQVILQGFTVSRGFQKSLLLLQGRYESYHRGSVLQGSFVVGNYNRGWIL